MTGTFALRKKIWVSERDFKSIISTVNSLMEKSHGNAVITAIHDEVAVAKSRFTEGTYRSSAIVQALGRDRNDVPLNLSVEEVATLLEEPDLPAHVKDILRNII